MSSESKNKPSKLATRLVSSLTLETEAVRSSETQVNLKRTTRHHVPEDSILHNRPKDNLLGDSLGKFKLMVPTILRRGAPTIIGSWAAAQFAQRIKRPS
jgi:hypothetical protein